MNNYELVKFAKVLSELDKMCIERNTRLNHPQKECLKLITDIAYEGVKRENYIV